MKKTTKVHKPERSTFELTWRCMGLSIVLAMLLAMSNAYLALKLGILASASIPAAIISMGVLRLFKNASVLEHNAVQTAASAGEAVAGGIVYTIPALIIVGYWHHFDYLTNVLIAISGGVLGVLFSVPLRRILVNDPNLAFPEGKAIAAVLVSTNEQIGLRDIVWGSVIGGMLELAQTGLKCLASSWTWWFAIKRHIVCIGLGFSATMLGAGYLVGFDMACSIGLGAVIAWLLALPVFSAVYPQFLVHATPSVAGMALWNQELRYFGIGAMLLAGIWTLMTLIKPLVQSMRSSLRTNQHIPSARRSGFATVCACIGIWHDDFGAYLLAKKCATYHADGIFCHSRDRYYCYGDFVYCDSRVHFLCDHRLFFWDGWCYRESREFGGDCWDPLCGLDVAVVDDKRFSVTTEYLPDCSSTGSGDCDCLGGHGHRRYSQ